MNIKTEINLVVKGIEATWYMVQEASQTIRLEMYNAGKEVAEQLTSEASGYNLIPLRLRKHYKSLIVSPDIESTAKFSVVQYPTEEPEHGILS